MGGTLAVGLAARVPGAVAALVTIGAPWDFAPVHGLAGGCRAAIRASGTERVESLLDAMGAAFGMVPVWLFQFLFALVNPIQAALKFQKLARLDPHGPSARLFVALEDWLADGVPMPVGAAKDLLLGWQIGNGTATGGWRFLGETVDPRQGAARRRCSSAGRPTASRRRRSPCRWAAPCRARRSSPRAPGTWA